MSVKETQCLAVPSENIYGTDCYSKRKPQLLIDGGGPGLLWAVLPDLCASGPRLYKMAADLGP